MSSQVASILSAFDADAPLEKASTIPAAWYTDTRIADLEKRLVFAKSWQMVGRVDQLALPGQFITADVAGEPIVVIRGNDQVLRAFFNVCRHHAAAVMTECAGKVERMKCPYHGWTYALDGSLERLTEFEGVVGFDRKDNGLVPVHVATWEKNVFVYIERAAAPPSIQDYFGQRLMSDVSALGLSALEHVERREWTLNCNWKVFVDNYLDGGYHVPFLHKDLNSVLSFKDYTIECFDRVCLQTSPITSSTNSNASTASSRKGKAQYYWLYPNLMLNWYEGYLDTNLIVPLGVDRVKVIFDFYFSPQDNADARSKSIDVSAHIQDEDHAICESVQRGLRSRAYEAGRLSVRREAGERLFHRLLATDLRASAKRHLPRI